MRLHRRTSILLAASLTACHAATPAFTEAFHEQRADLAATGRNPFFILEPGHQVTLEDGGERLVITVLTDTQLVDSVWTRVVEEREPSTVNSRKSRATSSPSAREPATCITSAKMSTCTRTDR